MLTAPVALLIVLRQMPSLDLGFYRPDFHLAVVSLIAGLASVVAVAGVVTAVRTHQSGPVLLGLGCAAVGILMLAHGLTTPDALGQPDNTWIQRFPYLAIAAFVGSLLLAAVRNDRRFSRIVRSHPVATMAIPLIPLVVFAAVIVARPTAFGGSGTFTDEETVRDIVAVAIVVCGVRVAFVHWRRWQLGHDIVQLSLVFAASMSVAATISLEHGQPPRLSWWDYHAYLLAGFGSAVYAIAVRFRTTSEARHALETAFSDDTFAHIVDGYPEALRRLVKAVELKDAYTHGHSQRTAALATELGVVLQLPADRLRAVARGAYLHDLGKIAVPDAILNKPGKLTADERAVIERHPTLGHEIASFAPELAEALGVILHHHERFDGGGYPAGLAGKDIPFEARVVSVADVWDALTSDRAYRPGWRPERALAHIVAGRGTHFDPTAVDALVELAAGWGLGAPAVDGDAAAAWEAVQTCHEVDRHELIEAEA